MNATVWDDELARFKKLNLRKKGIWASLIIFQLSIYARSTYEPGTEQVLHPKYLRRFNELVHRISSWQRDILMNASGTSDDDIFEMISDELEYLKVPSEPLIAFLTKFV